MDLKLALAKIGVCAYPALKSPEQDECCYGSYPPCSHALTKYGIMCLMCYECHMASSISI
jgi:hypothetical protein